MRYSHVYVVIGEDQYCLSFNTRSEETAWRKFGRGKVDTVVLCSANHTNTHLSFSVVGKWCEIEMGTDSFATSTQVSARRAMRAVRKAFRKREREIKRSVRKAFGETLRKSGKKRKRSETD